MSYFDKINEEAKDKWEQKGEDVGTNRGNRVWTGVFIIIVGMMAMLKSFDLPLPAWIFSWQMLLIGVGVFIGLRHSFQRGGWFILIIIGAAFLANEYFLETSIRKHLWPAVLILMGLVFILRPKKSTCAMRWRRKEYKALARQSAGTSWYDASTQRVDEENFIDSTSVFGSTKKIVLSKNFQGGDVVTVFGGSEINLSQADIQEKATLEVTAIFGGATLIIPSNWMLKSEAVSIFGGIQDKRALPSININSGKTLILRGTVLFGGIDIKSY
ncbi:MAG: hypothetical protein H7Y03_14315 [Chitinophagaceae bacterium]|nr:hypothetical protein [Chitinophagaceae bacterium]